jgi:hypothetical protein
MQLNRSLLLAVPSSALIVSCGLFGGPRESVVNVTVPSVANTAPIKVVFETDSRSNGGSALHVLVREVKRTDYPRVEYEDAARWLREGSDAKTLDWLVLMPGEECERELGRHVGSDVALFFMFATPSVEWKWLITSEEKEPVRLAVVDQGACTRSVNSEPSRSRDAVPYSSPKRKRCRSYDE